MRAGDSAPLSLTIDRLGHRGEGVARDNERAVFVPYALPGERVAGMMVGDDRARLVAIETASADRVEPICPLFQRCGGCALQHLELPALLAWKRSLVIDALRQRGIATDIAACIDAHGEGRRRVTLHVRYLSGQAQAGFMAARSHVLVAIDACPVLAAALHDAPRVARALGDALAAARKPLDVQITATETGLDVDIRGHGRAADADRVALTALGQRLGLARLSVHGEVLAEWRVPTITMGRALATPPPGGFLQATREGEQALARLVIADLEGARRVADLFSGCGPLTLRIAETARVHAVEIDKPTIDSLSRAARRASGLKPITTETRDLFRRPLTAHELDAYDAIVFDPPRAGAVDQAQMLALARKPRTIVAVSCNAATFARDARALIDGGWRLERVTPVDQFRYAAHVELVGVFRR